MRLDKVPIFDFLQVANALHNISLRAGLDSAFDPVHGTVPSSGASPGFASIFTPQHTSGGLGLFGKYAYANGEVPGVAFLLVISYLLDSVS